MERKDEKKEGEKAIWWDHKGSWSGICGNSGVECEKKLGTTQPNPSSKPERKKGLKTDRKRGGVGGPK